jgi:hypothetical protein
LLPWWTLAPILVIINTFYLLKFTKQRLKVTPAGMLQFASFYTGFLGFTARMARTANRLWICFIRMFTGKISGSRCIALTGADLNASKILCKAVFRTF